jgi:ParB family transcriptional regulator, chromosome partitioning protein
MANEKEGRRLGRGLDALIKGAQPEKAPRETKQAEPDARISISQIVPNPFQPRREFKPEDLNELQASLSASGLLQPITVRPTPGGKGYQLVAGERRLRAATALGWKDIPANVREVDDRALLTLALVENLQRSDLNPIEEAEGYKRLVDEFGLAHPQIAEMVGKDRSTIANLLRLLNLPVSVRNWVRSGELTVGHARALLALSDSASIQAFAKDVVSRGLSVRQTESLVRANATPKAGSTTRTARKQTAQAQAAAIEQRLRRRLQTDVAIQLRGAERGNVVITFYSADDLERLLELMGVGRDDLHD